jgi:hypothetical protein
MSGSMVRLLLRLDEIVPARLVGFGARIRHKAENDTIQPTLESSIMMCLNGMSSRMFFTNVFDFIVC